MGSLFLSYGRVPRAANTFRVTSLRSWFHLRKTQPRNHTIDTKKERATVQIDHYQESELTFDLEFSIIVSFPCELHIIFEDVRRRRTAFAALRAGCPSVATRYSSRCDRRRMAARLVPPAREHHARLDPNSFGVLSSSASRTRKAKQDRYRPRPVARDYIPATSLSLPSKTHDRTDSARFVSPQAVQKFALRIYQRRRVSDAVGTGLRRFSSGR